MIAKERVFSTIDREAEAITARGRALFNCPELGFQETETERMICDCLDAWGVPYEKDVSLTGVVARLGRGGYHIAVVVDMDALPRKAGGGCIHACGHSIQTNDALAALQALLPFTQDGSIDGRVSFFFTPAEELTDPQRREELLAAGVLKGRSGKQDMIANGWFDDVDCVLSLHASSYPGRRFDVDTVLTGFLTKRVTFRGKAAHSGAAPYLGRNALHGAVLTETALGLLKDQFPPESYTRIYPVVRDVSGGINIIPDEAVLETYVRAADQASLMEAAGRFDRCVRGCADALGLEADVETHPGYLPLIQSRQINQVAAENMLLFCNEEDITHDYVNGASGDLGDLGSLLPTIQFGFSGVDGAFHSDEFTIRDEEFCYLTVSKVLAGTAADLLNHPELRPERPADFEARKQAYLRDWVHMG